MSIITLPSRKSKGRVLVTGGAGYIGSNTVIALQEAGWDVVVADNLSTGSRRLVPQGVPVHVGDVGDARFIRELIVDVNPQAVIHFAGSLSVPESVAEPLKYYTNNFCNTCVLVQACIDAGIDKFIFSSTAAVYGIPKGMPVSENAPKQPINPYGRSKSMIEDMLADVSAAAKFRYVALRYFNVAGADVKGRAGQVRDNSTNLIKVVSELAAGHREGMTVYGDDYPTADGTCVRDFIHVTDLANAHVAALEYLVKGGASDVMNCGYGAGYSVIDVLDAATDIMTRDLPYTMGPRRAGDPAEVIADPTKIQEKLDWKPQHADINIMLRSAIAWELNLQITRQAFLKQKTADRTAKTSGSHQIPLPPAHDWRAPTSGASLYH